ncbi:hypothetical protein CONCODRAFT_71067 [Conidiobolus coronatus NRRL 28638]|uniref:RING-type domain-containing protein n=1 Tax=Conidiobolus coronatus (strain ATCC 28846 / CBS 209.66 / NRRL 28638) TaxID=796925 RepID=A0A137P4V5_CONC2|nr:hypothetical protein CONCODRAFT_71067 [Conidiobolus coronatus NRRL 28638]|eukprot:KXN69954.1 hypothetical protein CONCODRAFT_71067 [Conidiobolus coronatus NRRL 28638]
MIPIWSLILYINICFCYNEQFQLRLSLNCANINQQQDSNCLSDHFDTIIKSDNIINTSPLIESINSSVGKSKNYYVLDLTLACTNQVTNSQVNGILKRNQNNEIVGYLQCTNSCSMQYQLAFANVTKVNTFILIADDCTHSIKKDQINNNQVILPIPDKQSFNQYWNTLINHTLQYNLDINSSNYALISLNPYTSNSLPLILSIILGCFIIFLILFICCLVRFRKKPTEDSSSTDIIDDYNNLYHDFEDGNSTTISLGGKELRSHYEIENNNEKSWEEEMNDVFEELSAKSPSLEDINLLSNVPMSEKPSVETAVSYNINFSQFVNEEISLSEPSPESATIPKHFSFRSFKDNSFGSQPKETSLNFPRMAAKIDPIPPRPPSISKTIQSSQLPYKKTRCSVCFLDYRYGEKVRSLSCGHTFHLECIDQWLIKFNTSDCPICYNDLKSSFLARSGSDIDTVPSTSSNMYNQSQDIQYSTSRNASRDIGVEIARSHTLQGSIIAEVQSYNSSTGSELSLPEPHLRKYHKLNKSRQSSINDE